MVLEWMESRQSAARPSSTPFSNRSASARLRHDLDEYIAHALEGSVRHATAIVGYFYQSAIEGKPLDHRLLRFLNAAWLRYCADKRTSIERSLFLVRPKRGNPGGVSAKRRLTPTDKVEAAQMVRELRQSGASEKAAVLTAADVFCVSPRTIRACMSFCKPEATLDQVGMFYLGPDAPE